MYHHTISLKIKGLYLFPTQTPYNGFLNLVSHSRDTLQFSHPQKIGSL